MALAIGVILLTLSILKFYNPGHITDWENLIIFSVLGLVLILTNILLFDSLKSVKVNHSRIIFEDKGVLNDINWKNVDRTGQIIVLPSLYYAIIEKKLIIFPTEKFFGTSSASTPFLRIDIDHSQMGAIIARAKEQYLL